MEKNDHIVSKIDVTYFNHSNLFTITKRYLCIVMFSQIKQTISFICVCIYWLFTVGIPWRSSCLVSLGLRCFCTSSFYSRTFRSFVTVAVT